MLLHNLSTRTPKFIKIRFSTAISTEINVLCNDYIQPGRIKWDSYNKRVQNADGV